MDLEFYLSAGSGSRPPKAWEVDRRRVNRFVRRRDRRVFNVGELIRPFVVAGTYVRRWF